jgi:hypothetical protein
VGSSIFGVASSRGSKCEQGNIGPLRSQPTGRMRCEIIGPLRRRTCDGVMPCRDGEVRAVVGNDPAWSRAIFAEMFSVIRVAASSWQDAKSDRLLATFLTNGDRQRTLYASPSANRRCGKGAWPSKTADVRCRAANESAVVPSDDSIAACLAQHHHHGDYRAHTERIATRANQHTGHVRFTSRMPGNVRQRRYSADQQNRG